VTAPTSALRRFIALSLLAVAGAMAGCASTTPLVQGPTSVRPVRTTVK